jgi:hypothetical protein
MAKGSATGRENGRAEKIRTVDSRSLAQNAAATLQIDGRKRASEEDPPSGSSTTNKQNQNNKTARAARLTASSGLGAVI